MNDRLENEINLIFSYLTLRKTIGILGISFPFVLALGAIIFFQTGIQSSISHYYHTGMGDVFVGTLCVIGFFLLSYKGYERADDIAGDLGCVFAIGVALFPTHLNADDEGIVGYIHLIFAAFFFFDLIYFSLFLFTKTGQDPPSRSKQQRNTVYKVCGCTMSVCILLIIIYKLFLQGVAISFKVDNPVFWLESIAVIAFGISWLTKGMAILKDETI